MVSISSFCFVFFLSEGLSLSVCLSVACSRSLSLSLLSSFYFLCFIRIFTFTLYFLHLSPQLVHTIFILLSLSLTHQFFLFSPFFTKFYTPVQLLSFSLSLFIYVYTTSCLSLFYLLSPFLCSIPPLSFSLCFFAQIPSFSFFLSPVYLLSTSYLFPSAYPLSFLYSLSLFLSLLLHSVHVFF